MSDPTLAMAAVVRFARAYYASLDFAHDLLHGERVVSLAKRIAEREGGDAFLVEAGAWLHQLHDEPGELDGFLALLPVTPSVRASLREIVGDCRPERIGPGSSLEARIVFDADALEVLGPWGAVREILCNARVRGKGWKEAVADTRAVQAQFEARLMTETARALAEQALEVARSFWDAYDRWSRLDM